MKKIISDDEMKKIELGLLKEVDQICKNNRYRYSLIGGTLLGAVRHKGFIPWDDDIDIALPRPDFDKFVDYCKNNQTSFDLKCIQTDKGYGSLHAKVCDKRTIIQDENVGNRWDCELGVFIDVFPIDGLGNTREEAVKTFRESAFKRELLVAANWKKYFRSNTHAWYYEPVRILMYLISRPISNEQLILSLEEQFRKKNFDKVKFCAPMSGSYREKEIIPTAYYNMFTTLPFEDARFSVISEYAKYLTSVYGDYMQLPPLDKRKSHHTFTPYWR